VGQKSITALLRTWPSLYFSILIHSFYSGLYSSKMAQDTDDQDPRMRISYLILQPPSPPRLLPSRPQPQQPQSQQSQPSQTPPRTRATRSQRRYLPKEHMHLFGSFRCIQYAPAEYRFCSHSFDKMYKRKRRRESTQSKESSRAHNADHQPRPQDLGVHSVPTTPRTREHRSSSNSIQDSTSRHSSEIPEVKRRKIEHVRQMELERTFLLLPSNAEERVLV